MYLFDPQGDGKPILNFRVDEPLLLHLWFTNLPKDSMTEFWKLSSIKQSNWVNHFYSNILERNYSRAVYSSAGELVGGNIPHNDITENRRLFNEWMDSTSDKELFLKIKLKKFVDEIGEHPALALASDVQCEECDHEEPAIIHVGTDRNLSAFAEEYSFLKNLFSQAPLETLPDIAGCIKCDSGRYVTPMMRQYARHKPGFCDCMPCRRSL